MKAVLALLGKKVLGGFTLLDTGRLIFYVKMGLLYCVKDIMQCCIHTPSYEKNGIAKGFSFL